MYNSTSIKHLTYIFFSISILYGRSSQGSQLMTKGRSLSLDPSDPRKCRDVPATEMESLAASAIEMGNQWTSVENRVFGMVLIHLFKKKSIIEHQVLSPVLGAKPGLM